MKLVIKMFILALLIISLLSGCGNNTNPADKGNQTVSEPVVPVDKLPAEPVMKGIAPLTGLPTKDVITARPIAVMINNMSLARPQSGLTHTDMLWEVLAEGGITRFIAIFQSDAFQDPIGPVRSIRPYLIKIGDSYDAVLAHAGGSAEAYKIIRTQRKENLDEIRNAGQAFWREKFRKAPHNLYTNLPKLRAAAKQKKYATKFTAPIFTFTDTGAVTADSTVALSVKIKFLLKSYIVSYEYNALTKQYMRDMNGAPHQDLTTKEQIAATNVAILGTDYKVLDAKGHLQINFTRGGPAKLLQLGKVVDGTWKQDRNGVIRLYKDGKELPFVKGKTHYLVVPGETSLDRSVQFN